MAQLKKRTGNQTGAKGASRRRGQDVEDSSIAKPKGIYRSTDLLYSPPSEPQAPRNSATKKGKDSGSSHPAHFLGHCQHLTGRGKLLVPRDQVPYTWVPTVRGGDATKRSP
jgi:hypothetical protein